MSLIKNTPNVSITPYYWLKNLHKAISASLCKNSRRAMDLDTGLNHAGKIIKNIIESQASIYWVGNGGSAAICSHLAQDMLNKLGAKSIFLDNSSLMTCMANDFGYENVYLLPLKILIKPGDLLIAVSSSGNSENIVLCAEMALENSISLISLSGINDTNGLWNMKCDLSFFVPSDLYGIVEIAHEAILHSVIESLWLTEKNSNNTEKFI